MTEAKNGPKASRKQQSKATFRDYSTLNMIKVTLGILFMLNLVTEMQGFVIISKTTIRPPSGRMQPHGMAATNGDSSSDLFDYFDPLLSPYAYPNGVSPKNGIATEQQGDNQRYEDPLHSPSASSRTPQPDRPETTAVNDNEPDLFDYFDPLLSPHAYPNGISPDSKPAEKQNQQRQSERGYQDDPLRLSKKSSTTAASLDATVCPQSSSVSQQDLNVFDPTLSPHLYPNGTPEAVVGDVTTSSSSSSYRVGILLMDHGSKLQASNDRLHELARIYQESVDDNSYVVRAAHMEIASPTIMEGLEQLLEQEVDEIICHPYFLSAGGRHVSQDIPRILQEAKESLQIEIPITTTEPVGASTTVMVSAIQTIVQKQESRGRLGRK